MNRFRSVLLIGWALTALGAVSASSAAAVEFHSNAADGHTIITVSQNGLATMSTTVGKITCEVATTSGTMATNTVPSITLSGSTSGCHFIVFGSTISATVNTNGCDMVAYANGEGELVCPAGKAITVLAAGCTLTIGPQKQGGATYTNVENHIKVVGEASGIKYSHSGFTCGNGSGTNGTINGEGTVKGSTTAGASVKIWVE